MQFRNVALTTDFSGASVASFATAVAWVDLLGADLRLVHVLGHLSPLAYGHTGVYSYDDHVTAAKAALEKAAAHAAFAGRRVSTDLLEGHGPACVAEFCSREGVDLLLTAASGHSAIEQALLGSFAEGLARRVPCPSLVIKASERADAGTLPKRVLAPTDFSEISRQTFPVVREVAQACDATVLLLHVLDAFAFVPMMDPSMMPSAPFPEEDLAERRDAARVHLEQIASEEFAGVPSEVLVHSGSPAGEAAQIAKDSNVDLIICGTHGRGRIEQFLLGSVAERLLHIAPCSVLTIRDSSA